MATNSAGYKKFTKKQLAKGRIKAAEVNRARGDARRAAKAGNTVPF
jgi:hypothetical protein